MTNQQSEQLPIRSSPSTNLLDIYRTKQDNGQMFHLPPRAIPLTYIQQQKEHVLTNFSKYVIVVLTFRVII